MTEITSHLSPEHYSSQDIVYKKVDSLFDELLGRISEVPVGKVWFDMRHVGLGVETNDSHVEIVTDTSIQTQEWTLPDLPITHDLKIARYETLRLERLHLPKGYNDHQAWEPREYLSAVLVKWNKKTRAIFHINTVGESHVITEIAFGHRSTRPGSPLDHSLGSGTNDIDVVINNIQDIISASPKND